MHCVIAAGDDCKFEVPVCAFDLDDKMTSDTKLMVLLK
jgi:hypothetical protein